MDRLWLHPRLLHQPPSLGGLDDLAPGTTVAGCRRTAAPGQPGRAAGGLATVTAAEAEAKLEVVRFSYQLVGILYYNPDIKSEVLPLMSEIHAPVDDLIVVLGTTHRVKPYCSSTPLPPGQWFCLSHQEVFGNNFQATAHSHEGERAHRMTWICSAHGPEGE